MCRGACAVLDAAARDGRRWVEGGPAPAPLVRGGMWLVVRRRREGGSLSSTAAAAFFLRGRRLRLRPVAAWVRMCLVRSLRRAKRLLQPACLHAKGRSPVWLRVCLVRVADSAKRFPQPACLHAKGRSPVWLRMCLASLLGRSKLLPQPACSQAKEEARAAPPRCCCCCFLRAAAGSPQPAPESAGSSRRPMASYAPHRLLVGIPRDRD